MEIEKLKKPEILENGWYSEYNQGWNECLAYLERKGHINNQLGISDGAIREKKDGKELNIEELKRAVKEVDKGEPDYSVFKTSGEYFIAGDIYNDALEKVLDAVKEYIKITED